MSEEAYQKWLKVNEGRVNTVLIGAPDEDGEVLVNSPLKSLSFSKVIPMGDGTYGICGMRGNINLRHLLYYSWCN